jgi:4'-phosphopantetheinyl transferase
MIAENQQPSEAPPVDRVEVWIAPSDTPDSAARVDGGGGHLTDDEQARASRFLQPADRERFVIGRWLARTTLSRFAPVAPRDWPFVIDDRGRPHLGHQPPGAPDLRFNLSHTHGLVACAVTVGREVGVDVEHTGRRVLHDVPERFFSPREVADLRACSDSEQHSVFFDYWTLKESYIKARGLGLALPLRHFSFVLDGTDSPTVTFAPELDDDPDSWQFALFRPTDSHRLAIAVRRHGPDLPIVIRARSQD